VAGGQKTNSNTSVWLCNGVLGSASKETESYVSIIWMWIVWIIMTTQMIKLAEMQLMECNISVLAHLEIQFYQKL
jgi:hypothetical protein